MQFKQSSIFGTCALFALMGGPAQAEDIDIFAAGPGSEGGVANVLMVLDNGANFAASVNDLRCSISPSGVVDTTGNGEHSTALDGTAAAVQQCALYSALSSLEATSTGAFNVAVMGFNATGLKSFNAATNAFTTSCVGNTGGCLLMPFARFDTTNKPRVLEWIRKWSKSNSPYGGDYVVSTTNSANGAVFQESWAYLYGKTGVSGRNYAAVAPTEQCGGRSIIFVGNAYRNNNTPGDQTNEANSPRLPLLGLSATSGKNAVPAATSAQKLIFTDSIKTICSAANEILATDEGKGVYALNWAAYLRAQGVSTFSIGILGPTCNAEYAAHLEKLGSLEVGGGGFFPTSNFAELKAAFSTAIARIISVNTAFASVSLPVSVNTQGSFLNQVFVGQFRPDKSFLPRWTGNLKQYRLGMVSDSLRTIDANGDPAINNLTGFISECARSYWTPTALDDYWGLTPSGDCSVANSRASNSPDGNIVEKGAQAYVLRNLVPADRDVKTCSPVFTSCTTLTNFNTANTAITPALLGASPDSQAGSIINWARGLNNRDGDVELQKSITAMRPSAHGDVVHSRPVAVNYGTDTAPQIVVFYGGNDGMLRAVNGNRDTALVSGGKTFAAGAELWSFMPPEFYGRIKRQFTNTQAITLPSGDNTGRTRKDYGVDGPINAFQGQVNGVDKKYIFATMRRGGRAIYAFDVGVAANPTLLWKKGCGDLLGDVNCNNDSNGDYRGIGQTWSSLKSLYVADYQSGASPLLIVGGGYDNCEDEDKVVSGVNYNHACSASAKGRKVYLIDAVTGALVKSFDTDRSVIADATIVTDSNGKAKYAYTADLGGNVYRITFAGSQATWSIMKIASLGCDNPALASCSLASANRKFMFGPSVVTPDNGVTYNILLGSGDREKPVRDYAATQSVTNYFFMLKDRPADASWLSAEATVTGCGLLNSFLCINSLVPITPGVKPTDTVLNAKKGWYLRLTSTEQVVTSALTLFGVTTFSTSQPPMVSAETCRANLGTTRVYNINYLNAFSATNEALPFATVVGGGLPPSPVGGLVTLDNGDTVPFCIGCRAESPLESKLAGAVSNVFKPIGRTYWYIKQ